MSAIEKSHVLAGGQAFFDERSRWRCGRDPVAMADDLVTHAADVVQHGFIQLALGALGFVEFIRAECRAPGAGGDPPTSMAGALGFGLEALEFLLAELTAALRRSGSLSSSSGSKMSAISGWARRN